MLPTTRLNLSSSRTQHKNINAKIYTENQVWERRLVSFIRFYLHDERKNYMHINDYAITLFYSRARVQIPTRVPLCRQVSNF